MKVKVVNNSSRKTRKLIRATFAEMLSEKGTIDKITVTELVKRANINRGTFYTHYDDVYAVAEDFETEILEQFDAASADIADIDAFVESFFAFIKENEPYYKMLCRSNRIPVRVKQTRRHRVEPACANCAKPFSATLTRTSKSRSIFSSRDLRTNSYVTAAGCPITTPTNCTPTPNCGTKTSLSTSSPSPRNCKQPYANNKYSPRAIRQ